MTRRSRPDTGNHAFWLMVAASALLRALLIYGVCCLVASLFDAVRAGGVTALWSGDPNLLPGSALLAVVIVGVSRATCLLARAGQHSLAFARHVRASAVPAPARLTAAVPKGRLVIAESPAPFALTYGAFRPSILLTTGLLRGLSDTELRAVLAHEVEHLRNRDPLKKVLANAIFVRHFYLPALASLREGFAAARELSADRAALASNSVAALAGALLKVTEGPAWAAAAPSAAMSTEDLLEARVCQLETGYAPHSEPVGRRNRLATLGSCLLLIPAIAWSGLIVAHYMPACVPHLG